MIGANSTVQLASITLTLTVASGFTNYGTITGTQVGISLEPTGSITGTGVTVSNFGLVTGAAGIIARGPTGTADTIVNQPGECDLRIVGRSFQSPVIGIMAE